MEKLIVSPPIPAVESIKFNDLVFIFLFLKKLINIVFIQDVWIGFVILYLPILVIFNLLLLSLIFFKSLSLKKFFGLKFSIIIGFSSLIKI